MQLIDVHCHLESDLFNGQLDRIIADAKGAGVVKMITSSITPDQWEMSQSIAARYEEVEFSLGVHPWYLSLSDINKIESLAGIRETGAVAIGEIGLDRKVDNPGFEDQLTIFERQLRIACEVDIPVIIHCRGAFNELIQCFKRIGTPRSGGIIHSFSGSAELAEELMRYRMNFSIGGVLTYSPGKKRAKLLERIYPGHFLLETDSPDIPPVQTGEKPNVPANIIHNLHAASDLLGVPAEEIAFHTTENAVKIFGLNI